MIISHKRGRGKKIHLFIDDEYKITTDIDFWYKNFIKDGTDIDDEQWQELCDKIYYRKAVEKCYDLLSRRDHSAKELKTKLLRTSDEKNADSAIQKMIELGYIDDRKYAEKLIEYLVGTRRMSKAFVKQEMYKRGVPGDIAADIIADYEFDNVAVLVDLINTKYKNKLCAENGREKVTAALMRKGFSYSDIRSAFNLINEDSDEI